MSTHFKDVMLKRTDEELIKIVTMERNDYQPSAVLAAEEEIKNRNIDTKIIEEIKTNLILKIEEKKLLDAKKVSSLKRLVHFVIDYIIIKTLLILLIFVIYHIFSLKNQTLFTIFSYMISITVFFGYYIFMETKFQKTVGKFITKTSVTTKDGNKPKLGDIVGRTFCRLIPFDVVSFLFTSNGFHDKLSNTTIIRDDKKIKN